MARKTRDGLTDKRATGLFSKLCTAYGGLYGPVDDTALHIINDIAMLEQLKQACWADVAEKGVMTYWKNGNGQEGYREHPLLSKINQSTEQQRKLLVELRLTPASRKLITVPSEADAFEAF